MVIDQAIDTSTSTGRLVVPLNGANLLQITTNYTFDAPLHKAVLASMGGAMQMGLKGFGDNAVPVNAAPLRVAHLLFGSTALATTRALAPGHQLQRQVGMRTMRVPAIPATEKIQLTPAFVTQPVMTSGGLIITPGPKLTTMGGLTNTVGGPLLRLFTETTTNYGLSFTTGTVFARGLRRGEGADAPRRGLRAKASGAG